MKTKIVLFAMASVLASSAFLGNGLGAGNQLALKDVGGGEFLIGAGSQVGVFRYVATLTDAIFADGFDGDNGGGTPATLSETVDMTPVPQNSIACGGNGTTADNQYWRRYYFSEYAVTRSADIDSVDVSIEQTTGAPNMTVTLYTIPHAVAVDTIDLTQLTQIGQSVVASPADASLTSINVPVSGTVTDPVGDDLVVEVSTDDGSADGTAFYIGSTNLAETHPSFLSSASCGTDTPTPTADLGFPNWCCSDSTAYGAQVAFYGLNRDLPSGPGNYGIHYQVFYNAIPITATKTVAAVTLPNATQIHIFDMAVQP